MTLKFANNHLSIQISYDENDEQQRQDVNYLIEMIASKHDFEEVFKGDYLIIEDEAMNDVIEIQKIESPEDLFIV